MRSRAAKAKHESRHVSVRIRSGALAAARGGPSGLTSCRSRRARTTVSTATGSPSQRGSAQRSSRPQQVRPERWSEHAEGEPLMMNPPPPETMHCPGPPQVGHCVSGSAAMDLPRLECSAGPALIVVMSAYSYSRRFQHLGGAIAQQRGRGIRAGRRSDAHRGSTPPRYAGRPGSRPGWRCPRPQKTCTRSSPIPTRLTTTPNGTCSCRSISTASRRSWRPKGVGSVVRGQGPRLAPRRPRDTTSRAARPE